MSFITTANPPVQGTEPAVANDGFFPAIDCAKLRDDIRLDGTVTPARLHAAIADAMWTVNAELREWRAAHLLAGRSTLADVPADSIAGESVKVRQYRQAIYAHVQAQLAEAYRDISTLPQGAGKDARVMTALDIRVDSFNQRLRWAIADLKETSRVIAELL